MRYHYLLGPFYILITGISSLYGVEKLTAPPAPFAAAEIIQAMPVIEAKEVIKTHGTKGTPKMSYSISCGDNVLQLRHNLPLIQYLYTGGAPKPIMGISYWGSTKAGSGSPFKGDLGVVSLDKEKNSIVIKKSFFASAKDKKDGVFTEKIDILKDGLVNFDYSFELPSGTGRIDKGLFLTFRPFQNVAGMKMLIDGKPYRISDNKAPYGRRNVFKGKMHKIVFNPDKPASSFTLMFSDGNYLYIEERKNEADKGNQWKYCVVMRITPAKDGHISFKLDMRNTSGESLKNTNTYNGINFWKNDRINIPDFASSRNLLPNPSFESGLRYYNNFSTWGKWPGRDYSIYNIDKDNVRSGKRSLRISVWKAYPDPNFINTFTIPTKPGSKYTFSFYAKSEAPGQILEFNCVTAQWGKFPKHQSFKLTGDWKRYSVTFTAPNSAATVMFKVKNYSNKEKVDSFIDDLQLEENEHASEFANRPFGSELTTSDPDNFLDPKQKVNAKLRIYGPPDLTGTVDYKVKDFYYRELAGGKAQFKTDASGEALITLPLDGKLGTGVFVVTAEYNFADGKKYSDYYRLTIMKLIDKDFKHRELFACGSDVRNCRGEASVRRLRGLGFGSNNYQTTKLQNDLFAKYGIRNTGSGVLGCGPKGKDSVLQLQNALRKRLKVEPYSEALKDEIEKLSYQLAKANPWVNEWFIHGECNSGAGKFKVLTDRDNKSFAKFILACYDGVKKADPAKKFALTGGPANMLKNGGIRDIDNWLGCVRELRPGIKFDAIAIHPYRRVPESPDLDADTVTLLKVLHKYGYDEVPIYWNEGIYHRAWQVKEWGLDPHKGCSTDHWRCGTPTYDMGWGERIAAAYYARSWLVGLKYADHIKSYNGWGGTNMSIDTEMTPLALQKIPNTLAHILGNATYKADIRFAPNLRAYVFEDEKQRPVAALWSYVPMVDRGFEPSPEAEIKFSGLNPEFIDLMGNKVLASIDKNGCAVIPVGPFPLFIRTEAGSLNTLCSVLKNARLKNSNEFPLNVSLQLKNQTQAEIIFNNRISRDFTGTVEITSESKPVREKLAIREMTSKSVTITLPQKISASQINKISIPVKVTEDKGGSVSKDLALWAQAALYRNKPIKIDGNGDDWKDIPSIKLSNMQIFKTSGGTRSLPVKHSYGGKADFSAEYKLAWDRDFLYLYVGVTDDKAWFPAMKNDSSDWTKDSLQVYIDTLGDNGRRISKETFDFNDYNYDISMTSAKGKVNVYRRAAPEQQIAGGLDAPKPNMVEPGVKAAVKLTSTGYVYEVAFPRRLIAPLNLKENTFFRLGLMINDNDGKGPKGGLSNIPGKNTSPYKNPEQWPGILLVREADK